MVGAMAQAIEPRMNRLIEISMITRHTLIQLSTPDALRGRVSSVNMIFIGASNQLGDVESGFLAAWLGAPITVLFGGGV